jgi:hypothetical protein
MDVLVRSSQFALDATVPKVAISVLARLAEEASPSDHLGLSILQWMIQNGASSCCTVLLRPEFDPRDAEGSRVVKNVASLHRTLVIKASAGSSEAFQSLVSSIARGLHFISQSVCDEYVHVLSRGDARSAEHALRSIVQNLRHNGSPAAVLSSPLSLAHPPSGDNVPASPTA